MLRLIAGFLFARWFLGVLAVVLGGAVIYWAVRQVAGERDVVG
jgi:hypothetical protein